MERQPSHEDRFTSYIQSIFGSDYDNNHQKEPKGSIFDSIYEISNEHGLSSKASKKYQVYEPKTSSEYWSVLMRNRPSKESETFSRQVSIFFTMACRPWMLFFGCRYGIGLCLLFIPVNSDSEVRCWWKGSKFWNFSSFRGFSEAFGLINDYRKFFSLLPLATFYEYIFLLFSRKAFPFVFAFFAFFFAKTYI